MTEEGFHSTPQVKEVIRRLLAIPENKYCFDCNEKDPKYASVTYGVFICHICSRSHHTDHLSLVRSTLLDKSWSWIQLRHMQIGGNIKAINFFSQHQCNSLGLRIKYKSKAADLYRKFLQEEVSKYNEMHGDQIVFDKIGNSGYGGNSQYDALAWAQLMSLDQAASTSLENAQFASDEGCYSSSGEETQAAPLVVARDRTGEHAGHPIQIVEIVMNSNKPSRMCVSKTNLRSIMLNKVGNRNISLISVAGPSRLGKSFLLSFMVRYLEALENGESTDWIDRLDRHKALVGFPFQNGIDRLTTGIWLWSHPFIIKNAVGEEIAVLLMDSQGVFDDHTTMKEWSAIIGISLLTSSCLIYNVVNNLQEDALAILETFTQFGILAMENSDSVESCFQKLVFLIRDWNMPDDCEYGPLGGQKFLNHKLQIQQHLPPESIRIRQTLKKCFEEIDCFLMPDPGKEAKSNDFRGSLAELDEKFVKHLFTFMDSLISPEQISVKMVDGQPIKGKDLLTYFQSYITLFNTSGIPSPANILDAKAYASYDTLVLQCLMSAKEQFLKILERKEFVSSQEWGPLFNPLQIEAMKMYDTKRKFGDPKIAAQQRRRLESELLMILKDIKEKNEELINERIGKEQVQLIEEFSSRISNILDNNFLMKEKLETIIFQETESIIKNFCGAFSQCNEILEGYVPILTEKIKEVTNQFRSKNDDKIAKASQVLNTVLEQSFRKYKDDMDLNILQKGEGTVSEELLRKLDETLRNQVLSSFQTLSFLGPEDFVTNFREQLDNQMNEQFARYVDGNSEMQVKQQNKTEDLINLLTKLYLQNMSENLERETPPDRYILEQKHFQLHQAYLDRFMSECGIQDVLSLIPFKQLFNASLQDAFERVQLKFLKNLKEARQNDIDSIVRSYKVKIAEMLSDPERCNLDYLKIEHQQAVENYRLQIHFPNFFTPEENDSYLKILTLQLSQVFEDFLATYQDNIDRADNFIADIVNQYSQKMDEKMNLSVQKSQLDAYNEEVRCIAKAEFQEKVKQLPSELYRHYKAKLNSKLEEESFFIFSKFNKSVMERVTKESEKCLSLYKDEMKMAVSKNIDSLQEWHELYKDKSLYKFDYSIGNFGDQFNIEKKKLEINILAELDTLKLKTDEAREKRKTEVQLILDNAIVEYKSNAASLINGIFERESLFLEELIALKVRMIQNVRQELEKAHPIFEFHLAEFGITLDYLQLSYFENYIKLRSDSEKQEMVGIVEAFNSKSIKEYRDNITILVNNAEELFSSHKNEKRRILNEFNSLLLTLKSVSFKMYSHLKEKLENEIKNAYHDIEAKLMELNDKAKKVYQDCISEYRKQMKTNVCPKDETDSILKWHKFFKQTCCDNFDRKIIIVFKQNTGTLRSQLQNEIEMEYSRILDSNREEKERMSNLMQKFVDDRVEAFTELYNDKNFIFDQDELYTKLRVDKNSALSKFENFLQHQNIVSSLQKKYADIFEKTLKDAKNTILTKRKADMKNMEHRFEDAYNNILSEYKNDILELCHRTSDLSTATLTQFKDLYKKNYLFKFEKYVQNEKYSYEYFFKNQDLEQAMDKEFEECIAEIILQREKKKKQIDKFLTSIVLSLKNEVQRFINHTNCQDESEVIKKLDEETIICWKYLRFPNDVTIEEIPNCQKELTELIQTEHKSILAEFNREAMHITEEVNHVYNECLSKYNKLMNEKMDLAVVNDVLCQWHEVYKETILLDFKQSTSDSKWNWSFLSQQLEGEIQKKFQESKYCNLTEENKLLFTTRQFVKDIEVKYKNDVQMFLKRKSCRNTDELLEFLKRESGLCLAAFEEKCHKNFISKDSTIEFKTDLETKLDEINKNYELKFREIVSKIIEIRDNIFRQFTAVIEVRFLKNLEIDDLHYLNCVLKQKYLEDFNSQLSILMDGNCIDINCELYRKHLQTEIDNDFERRLNDRTDEQKLKNIMFNSIENYKKKVEVLFNATLSSSLNEAQILLTLTEQKLSTLDEFDQCQNNCDIVMNRVKWQLNKKIDDLQVTYISRLLILQNTPCPFKEFREPYYLNSNTVGLSQIQTNNKSEICEVPPVTILSLKVYDDEMKSWLASDSLNSLTDFEKCHEVSLEKARNCFGSKEDLSFDREAGLKRLYDSFKQEFLHRLNQIKAEALQRCSRSLSNLSLYNSIN